MTRVTAPREIARLMRSLSTTPAAPRPVRLPGNVSKTAAASRVRRELEQQQQQQQQQQDVSASERTITTSHRPAAAAAAALTPNPNRVIPLMQCFHTNPRAPRAQPDPSTMDFAVLPSPDMLSPSASSPAGNEDLFSRVRVPLLPDNFAPARSPTVGHAPEAPDGPLAAPEIVVMAADPDSVNAVSALTEVEGMGPDGVELQFVHDRAGRRPGAGGDADYAGGMLRDLWSGFVDDVLGGAQGKARPAV